MIKNKHVVISGGTSGIGKELVLQLYEHNTLYVLARNEEKLIRLKDLNPNKIFVFSCDIASNQQVIENINEIKNKTQHIDILINNAGTSDARSFTDYDYKDLEKIINTNLTGSINLTLNIMPLILRSKGSIINVGSMFGDIAHPLYSVYSATKFGIRGFSDALRREYMHKEIKVFYVAPRATATASLDKTKEIGKYFDMNIDKPEHVAKHILKEYQKSNLHIYPKSIERLFVFIQKLLPSVIDNNLNSKIKKII